MDAPIAEITSYADLLVALRRRMVQLDATFESLDDVSGLSHGYSAKLLSSNPVKCLGLVSFGAILGALGLKIVVVEDAEQLERVQHRLVGRDLRGTNGPHKLWRERVLSSGDQTATST
jgi:hypothetical protein